MRLVMPQDTLYKGRSYLWLQDQMISDEEFRALPSALGAKDYPFVYVVTASSDMLAAEQYRRAYAGGATKVAILNLSDTELMAVNAVIGGTEAGHDLVTMPEVISNAIHGATEAVKSTGTILKYLPWAIVALAAVGVVIVVISAARS